LAERGDISLKKEARKIREKPVSFEVKRILEIEEETRHDVVAFNSCCFSDHLAKETQMDSYGTSTECCLTQLRIPLKASK